MKFVVLFLTVAVLHGSYARPYLCDPTAKCGCSQKSSLLRKLIAEDSNNEEYWGWLVSIKDSDKFFCGGSILSSSWILTTAICARDMPRFNITVSAGAQTRRVDQIVIHPAFDELLTLNDIALVRLDVPLDLENGSLTPICLSALQSAENSPLVTVTWGFGQTDETTGIFGEIPVKLVEDKQEGCSELIRNSSVQVCASITAGTRDTCAGDTGNPLMMYTGSRQWTVVGLVSYGRGCSGENPTVYTRVSVFLDWIKSVAVETMFAPDKKLRK